MKFLEAAAAIAHMQHTCVMEDYLLMNCLNRLGQQDDVAKEA